MYLADGKLSTEFSRGAMKAGLKLKVGETQSMTFTSDAAPPFYERDAARHDTTTRATRTAKGKVKEGYAGKPKGEK